MNKKIYETINWETLKISVIYFYDLSFSYWSQPPLVLVLVLPLNFLKVLLELTSFKGISYLLGVIPMLNNYGANFWGYLKNKLNVFKW